MEMERVIEFPHADMDRRPRKRPRLGWDVAPQALKEVNEMWASLGYYRQRMLLFHRSRFLSETDVANHTLFHKHSNQHKQEPSQQMHFSPAYFDSQKLPNFLQQPLGTQFPHASSEGRSSARRSAHALVTFGFGGKLIVMKDNSSLKNLTYGGQESDGSVINILNLMDVAMDKTDTSGTRSGVCDYLYTLCQQSFPSPLVCGNVGSREVNKWIDEKIANCKSPDMDYRKGELLRLFFFLLKIACQYYGKLRSPFGTDHAMKGSKTHMGGTMRLGSRRTYFQVADCLSAKLYGNKSFIDERHRHRYEVNPDMVAQLEDAGLSFTGKDESGQRMKIVGLSGHPFYVGVQFHPEFKSRPGKPSALFLGLIAAACGQLDAVLKKSGTKTTAMSNGTSAIKSHQYGNADKTPNWSLGVVYSNGNGVHC